MAEPRRIEQDDAWCVVVASEGGDPRVTTEVRVKELMDYVKVLGLVCVGLKPMPGRRDAAQAEET